jgi:O-antigen/teichoic acid export membrane protein
LGEEFTAAVPILVLLATGYFLNSVTGPSTVALSMSHHEGDVALVNWAAVVARVVAGLVCAHFWGAIGLAASAATITALTYFVLWWAARRRVSVSTHATLRPDPSLLRKVSG